MLQQQPTALFINPVNWEGVKGSLIEARRKKVPVVIVDAPVADPDLVLTQVASDNVEAGRLACEALARVNPNAKLAILHLSVNKACIDRVDGFRAEMLKHPGMKLLDTQTHIMMGIADDEAQAFAFVELPGGRSAHVHRVPEGDGFHVVLIDATADTARQRAVQQLGNQAEIASHEKSRALSKLKRVRSELEAQRTQLEEAVALKSAMLASLSHEFRTPLTSVFGYLHLLERRHAQDTASQAPLRAVRRAATHLFALSENLLEYARRDSGGSLVNAGPVDLQRLAEDIRDLFAALAAEQKLEFAVRADVAGGAPPISDELKLRQMLINLVSNAVRYAAQGRVEVRVHDSTADMRYLVLPMRPKGTEGWSEDRLAAIVTRDTMIGVTVPRAAP